MPVTTVKGHKWRMSLQITPSAVAAPKMSFTNVVAKVGTSSATMAKPN